MSLVVTMKPQTMALLLDGAATPAVRYLDHILGLPRDPGPVAPDHALARGCGLHLVRMLEILLEPDAVVRVADTAVIAQAARKECLVVERRGTYSVGMGTSDPGEEGHWQQSIQITLTSGSARQTIAQVLAAQVAGESPRPLSLGRQDTAGRVEHEIPVAPQDVTEVASELLGSLTHAP